VPQIPIRTLGQEFVALIGDDWSLYPSISYKGLTDGTVVHQSVTDFKEIEGSVANDLIFDVPERYGEDAGRAWKSISGQII
jgi:hypothetical protein